MLIEDGIATFELNMVGDIEKHTYIGQFKVNCLLTPIDEIKADKLYRELLGDTMIMASERSKNAAFALAQLKYRVLEAPPFWLNTVLGGGHIKDYNIIMEVLEKAIEAQEQYKLNKAKEYEERQKKFTKMIKNKQLEREEEVINPHKTTNNPEEVEIEG